MRALLAALLLAPPTAAQNHLILVADDVGVDRVAVYAAHPDPGRTPVIDGLAARGVLFRNAWACPVCSSTRAALLTGRYGFRTGIGTIIRGDIGGAGLPAAERTLAELLRATHSCAALGKWHLGGLEQGPLHAQRQGFTLFEGQRFNLSYGDGDYFRWTKTVGGEEKEVEGYVTTDTVDDAIRALTTLEEPWLVHVGFNAAHTPVHAPPAHLHHYALEGDPEDSHALHVMAMIEALDTEIGRLLEHVDMEDTTVYFLGDNGTDGAAMTPPSNPRRGKGSLYEGGVHVPLIVAGQAVKKPGGECAALVHVADLFATVAELAGRESEAEDSVSLVPYLADPGRASIRETVYTEKFVPNGPGPYTVHRRAIRGPRYKLTTNVLTGSEMLFDLEQDPGETANLLRGETGEEARAAYERLKAALAELVGD